MKEILFDKPGWQILRQTLSLALMKCEPVRIREGGAILSCSPESSAIFEGLKAAVSSTGSGFLDMQEGDILYLPENPGHGRFSIDTGKYCPLSELELFLMPALFNMEFRSVISFTGVTHSHLSYSTAFIKETLLGLLEKTGYYGSLSLKRFGFYGSGGGIAESRIYPAEPLICPNILDSGQVVLEGVKIFVSRMSRELASREKDFILTNTAADEQNVTIMEIMDSDGFGNCIQLFFRCGDYFFVMSKDMAMYNSAGDFIFDEAPYYRGLADLAEECRAFLAGGGIPVRLASEVIPYLFMSGSPVPKQLAETEIFRICGLFF